MKFRALIFFLFPLYLPAQELSGVWTGYLQTHDNYLPFELALSSDEEKISGYSQIIYLVDGIENIGIKTIKVTQRKKDFLIEDGKLIFDNYTIPPIRSKLIGSLSFSVKGAELILEGTFRTRSLNMRDKTSYEGTIFLKKSNPAAYTNLTTKLDEMNLLENLSLSPTLNTTTSLPIAESNEVIIAKDLITDAPEIVNKRTLNHEVSYSTRQTEILSNLFYSSDSLVISLYDNGTVDGDSVSVFLNDKMIVSKGKLSSEAIRVTVSVNDFPGDSIKLVMFAENLGTISPNTGLLIIQDKKERHDIRFAIDMQKNSGIILRKRL